jgi:hypothetical protein
MITMTKPTLPSGWNAADQLDGLDLVDKGELIGKPFRITSVSFEENARGVSYVYVDAEDANTNGFTFNDSSSGVRAQLVAHLTRIGQDKIIDTGDALELSVVIPRGLRMSEYEVKDDYGKTKKARTYYLTTSGKRAGATATTT